MNELLFEILKLAILALGAVVTYMFIPWLKANTTEKQRVEAEYWIKLAVKIAEQIYQDKGMGMFKKEFVLEWLNKNNIKITEEQASVLIDIVVKQYNAKGWE